MTPIWKSIGGQNEAVLNLLNQFIGDSLGVKGFNVDIVFFGCHNKQLKMKNNNFEIVFEMLKG